MLPPLPKAGVVVIVLGAIVDSVAHATAPSHFVGFTPAEQAGHLTILIGMLYTLGGVILDPLISRRPNRRTVSRRAAKGGSYAHR